MSYNRAEICALQSPLLSRPEARLWPHRSSMTYDNALNAISYSDSRVALGFV